jgi:hypothetical protein
MKDWTRKRVDLAVKIALEKRIKEVEKDLDRLVDRAETDKSVQTDIRDTMMFLDELKAKLALYGKKG